MTFLFKVEFENMVIIEKKIKACNMNYAGRTAQILAKNFSKKIGSNWKSWEVVKI